MAGDSRVTRVRRRGEGADADQGANASGAGQGGDARARALDTRLASSSGSDAMVRDALSTPSLLSSSLLPSSTTRETRRSGSEISNVAATAEHSSSLRARKGARSSHRVEAADTDDTDLSQADGAFEKLTSTSSTPLDPKVSDTTMPGRPSTPAKPSWVFWALTSGCFAAMNGVFAKLTTSSNTSALAAFLQPSLPFLTADLLTLLLRALFFSLNLASNAVMWVLFTRALTSHPSTTKVSVVNTSANFALTAVLGALVFGENVGGWGGVVGLALLVAGCVVLGRGQTGEEKETVPVDQGVGVRVEGGGRFDDDGGADVDLEFGERDGLLMKGRAAEEMEDVKDKEDGAKVRYEILDGTESDAESERERRR